MDINALAAQSNLSLNCEELDLTREQLMDLIALADHMNDIDIDGVEPMFSPSESHDVFLTEPDDRPPTREEALANARETRDGCFLVPPVVE
ncbi:MAG: Asp-tRNA(Asn)/Glu-tRNA(Gln) amidotransferase subunit GatC [Saccharofermentanales bacterium]